ncbi:MAG: hypothetical protein KatS3mg102_0664 [Planctomycetota bacterium]|nr:MAG: hypothetical protein KatS3mg102_0664 [Planctomycetota bacterium]
MQASSTLPATLIAGRYRVRAVLGRGAMGEVLLVEDVLPPGRTLALKRFHPDATLQPEAIAALGREFQTLRELRHPHLAEVLDFGWTEGPSGIRVPFFTAEYVAGLDLYQATRGAEPELVWELFEQLLDALGYVHARGVVHRDIKPGNVLVARGAGGAPHLKLIDFGLAGTARSAPEAVPRGTARYLAPEVIERGEASPRSDLYAVGVTLYEVLTGVPPFRGSTREVLRQHLESHPRPPSELRPELSDAVDRLVLRLLEKDPAARPRTAEEVRAALRTASGMGPAVAAAIAELRAGGEHRDGAGSRGGPGPALGAAGGLGIGRAVALAAPLPVAGLLGRERERAAALAWLERGLPSLLPLEVTALDAVGGAPAPAELAAGHTDGAPAVPAPGPPVLVVAGDLGVGKTRLLLELKHHAQLRGVTVLEASCELGARAYAPFAELLRALVQILGEREAEALLGPSAPQLGRFLGEDAAGEACTHAGTEPRAEPPGVDVERERARLFDAIATFLLAAAWRRPLLLVLHELHRADAGTLALLGHLARVAAFAGGHRLRFAASIRARLPLPLPGGEPGRRAGGALSALDADLLALIPLGPLEPAAVRDLVCAALGCTEVPGELVAVLHEQTGGNPYFLQETLKSMLERGVIGREDGRLVLRGALAPLVPLSVAEVLRERLQQLGPGERQVLEILAAARLPLSSRNLAELGALAGRALRAALTALVHRGLVVAEERAGRERSYRCVHELLRQVVVRGIGPAERRALHRRLGEWLEQRARRGAEAVDPALLAEHFREAGEPGRAFHYGALAGDQARRLYANERAIALYEEALRQGRRAGAAPRALLGVLEALGLVRERIGDHAGAAQLYREALAEGEAAGVLQNDDRARLLLRLGETQETAGAYDDALATFAAGVRALGLELPSPAAARLLGATASVYIKTGRFEEALKWVNAGLEMAGEEPSAERAGLLNVGGVALLCRGDVAAAAEWFEESLRLREQLGDREAIARTHNNLGAAYVEAGQLGRAVWSFERALELSRQTGDVRGAAESAAHLGSVRLSLGELERALELFERSLALAERIGDPDGVLAALQRLARFEIELGHLDAAHERIQRAERIVERLRHAAAARTAVPEPYPTRECVLVALVQGRFQLTVGELERAERLLLEAGEAAARFGALREQAEALKLRARVLGECSRYDEAERLLDQAQQLYAQLGNDPEYARATIDRIDLMVRLGEPALASMALAELRERLGEGRLPPRLLAPLKLAEGRLLAAHAAAGQAGALEQAVLRLEEARRHAREGRRPELVWRVEHALALAEEAAGALERALKAAIRGMETLRQLSDRVPAPLRQRYLELPSRQALRQTFRRLHARWRQAAGNVSETQPFDGAPRTG